jgi:hypothetical protein
MCTFCNKKKFEKVSLLLFLLLQYEKRKLACRTLYLKFNFIPKLLKCYMTDAVIICYWVGV